MFLNSIVFLLLYLVFLFYSRKEACSLNFRMIILRFCSSWSTFIHILLSVFFFHLWLSCKRTTCRLLLSRKASHSCELSQFFWETQILKQISKLPKNIEISSKKYKVFRKISLKLHIVLQKGERNCLKKKIYPSIEVTICQIVIKDLQNSKHAFGSTVRVHDF